MIIRKYGDLPMVLAPDIGEVITARRSVMDPWLRAVVTYVRRQSNGLIKLSVYWLEDSPEAGSQGPKPIKANTRGWIRADPERLHVWIRQDDPA